MLTSGSRPVYLTGSQAVALGSASLLKRRVAVPSGTTPLPRMDRLRLRDAPLLGSSSLFSKSLMDGITEVRKAKQESSFMGNVAKLASSAQNVNSYRPSPSPSSSSQRAKKRPNPAPRPPQDSNASSPSASAPQARGGKSNFRGQGAPRRGKAKGKGRGGQ